MYFIIYVKTIPDVFLLGCFCFCSELQENLIRSHAAGVGPPLSPERTRRLLALRINVIAKGHSGLNPKNLKRMLEAFNGNPFI